MKEQFERYIDDKLKNMSADFVDLVSGDIHREIGGYPAKNHRMPLCCKVMYDKMHGNDEIIYSPSSGKGATLKIRYYKINHK